MNTNRVDTTLSEVGQAVVPAAIQTIRQKLPFLMGLSPEERHHLPAGPPVRGSRRGGQPAE